MKRLIKVSNSDLKDVKLILKRVDQASVNLKKEYYALFDNLQALFEAYPTLYKQIEMVVKLPTNDDAKDVVDFYNDLQDILDHLNDENYLRTYIDKPDTQIEIRKETKPDTSNIIDDAEVNEETDM